MLITSLDHLEFYVGNSPLTAFFLSRAYGFVVSAHAGPETGVPDCRSLLLEQGDIRLVLTSGLTPSHPATAYVSRHGDGVARLALGTSDAGAVFAEAVARGAAPVEPPRVYDEAGGRIVTAEVRAFGDVTHPIVERRGVPERFLPGFAAVPPAGGNRSLSMLEKVDHVAACLPKGELASTARFYESAFGFKQTFSYRVDSGEQGMDSQVVQSAAGEVTLTLIEPVSGRIPGQIEQFLERHGGAGVQHVAMLTQDIVGTVRELRSRGVRFLEAPDAYYDDLERELASDRRLLELRETKVLMDRDPWGELFQIFAEPVHERGTFFSEIIARHGARTFGGRNIRALYGAVQRAGI